MNIPVFHDDQHGTAIITAAGLINACLPHRTQPRRYEGRGQRRRRRRDRLHRADQGDGRAARKCASCATAPASSIRDREGGMDQWKSAHAANTDRRTLTEALVGADVFLGLSAAGALKPEMVKDMAPAPIIFAMANPDPEIRRRTGQGRAPRRDHRHRPVGLSEPGQQCPRLPLHLPRRARRARDRDQRGDEDRRRSRHRRIGARAGAGGSRAGLWQGAQLRPRIYHSAPFDPRLMEIVSPAVAKAAMDTGRRDQADPRHGRLSPHAAKARLNPTTSVLTLAYEGARAHPKRVIFAEAEEEVVLRAAIAVPRRRLWHAGAGRPRRRAGASLRALGVSDPDSFELHNSRNSPLVPAMVDFLYEPAPASRLSAPRLRADGEPGSQHLRLAAAPAGGGRCDDHRHHPHLFADAARSAPRDRSRRWPATARRHPPVLVGQNTTRCSSPTPRSTNAERRGTCRHRRTDRRRSPGAWGTNRASPSCPIRPSAIRRAAWLEISATR